MRRTLVRAPGEIGPSRRALRAGIGLAAWLACSGASGCWETPKPPRPPPAAVAPGPAALSDLSIYVHRLADPVENDDDRYDYSHMPGYTDGLRQEFGAA